MPQDLFEVNNIVYWLNKRSILDKESASFTGLHDFLNHHNMKTGGLSCEFSANISFSLSRGNYSEQKLVRVNMESGNVVIPALNPFEYPMDLKPMWQDYKLEGASLLITGEHKQNNLIGKYKITITPMV
jgi:hypothetical protein